MDENNEVYYIYIYIGITLELDISCKINIMGVGGCLTPKIYYQNAI